MFYGNVDVSQYEAAHGQRPRGEGMWAFIFDGGEPVYPPGGLMKWSLAKNWAIREARKRMADRVEVAS